MPYKTATREGQMELNEKVALLCGWKPEICLVCAKCETAYEADPNRDYSAGVFCPECRRNGYVMVGVCHPEPIPGKERPDYCNDLNACAEFRKHLKPEQCKVYVLNLGRVIAARADGGDWRDSFTFSFASAEDHCNAFVATMEAPSVPSGNVSDGASGVAAKPRDAVGEEKEDLEEKEA